MEKLFLNPEFSKEITLLKHPIPQLQSITSQEISKFLISLAKSKSDLKTQIPFNCLRNLVHLQEIIKFYDPKVNIQVQEKIYNHLVSKDLLKVYNISVSQVIKEKLTKTFGLIQNYLEKIDMALSDTNVTHILYPYKISSGENSKEWFRTVDKKYGLKILHYWYTPDSKDVYVQDTEEYPEPDGLDGHKGPWHLSLYWLLDSIKYSEWMNEADYEIDPQELINLKQEYEQISKEELDLKDDEFNSFDSMLLDDIEFQEDEEMGYLSEKEKQGSDASFHQSEDEDSEDDDEIEEDDDDSDFLLEEKEDVADDKSGSDELNSEAHSLSTFTSTKPLNIIKELSLFTLVDLERKAPARYKKQGYDPVEDGQWMNISHSVLELDSWIGNNRKRSPRKWFPADQEASESDKEIILKVLNSSSIFSGFKDIEEIHPIESDAFPSFCGKDATYVNRQVFKYIRNAMILAYASDPYSELTVMECYKHLRYDIHDLATVHNFLSHFSFINTQNISRSIPRTPFAQDYGILYESPSSIKDWIYSECKTAHDVSPHSLPASTMMDTCFHCGADITWNSQYVSRRFSEFSICLTCFADGHFPADMSSRDFDHVKGVPRKELNSFEKVDEAWKDEELLKLLEGIEKYDLSWYNVAENVGTKSAKQCLYRFYQYSIDDDIIYQSLCSKSQTVSDLWRTVVGQSSNPLMTFLSSLCSTLPDLAAESAKCALRFLGEKSKEPNPDIRSLTLQAALVAYNGALNCAESQIDAESSHIKHLIYQLTEKQVERVGLKFKTLEDFTNVQRNLPKIPEQNPPSKDVI